MYTKTKNTGRRHTCTTSVGFLKFFEDEERLKGRHVLVENYKAILYPKFTGHVFKETHLHSKCLYNRIRQEHKNKHQVKSHFSERKREKSQIQHCLKINYIKFKSMLFIKRSNKVAHYYKMRFLRQTIFLGSKIRHSKNCLPQENFP